MLETNETNSLIEHTQFGLDATKLAARHSHELAASSPRRRTDFATTRRTLSKRRDNQEARHCFCFLIDFLKVFLSTGPTQTRPNLNLNCAPARLKVGASGCHVTSATNKHTRREAEAKGTEARLKAPSLWDTKLAHSPAGELAPAGDTTNERAAPSSFREWGPPLEGNKRQQHATSASQSCAILIRSLAGNLRAPQKGTTARLLFAGAS